MKDYTIKKLDDSRVEITGEIAADVFESHRAHALEHLGHEVELPGFRKGKAPLELLVKHLGEETILRHMAEHAIGDVYPEILKAEQLDAIGRPEVTITKLAAGNPLGYTITTAVFPTLTLPDYEAIAKKINTEPAEPITVADAEVEQVLAEVKKNLGTENELSAEQLEKLGGFKSLEEFSAKIKENLTHEKEFRARNKRRLSILETIYQKTKGAIPAVMIEHETATMLAETKAEIERAGLTFADYLTHLKKTEADLKAGWADDARKRVVISLALKKIAKKQSISPEAEAVKERVTHYTSHNPNVDPDRVREYFEDILTNEAVAQYLENLQ